MLSLISILFPKSAERWKSKIYIYKPLIWPRGEKQELEEFQEAGLGIKNKPSQCPPSLETQLLYNNWSSS